MIFRLKTIDTVIHSVNNNNNKKINQLSSAIIHHNIIHRTTVKQTNSGTILWMNEWMVCDYQRMTQWCRRTSIYYCVLYYTRILSIIIIDNIFHRVHDSSQFGILRLHDVNSHITPIIYSTNFNSTTLISFQTKYFWQSRIN